MQIKDKLIEKMYEISKKPYQRFFKKNQPWTIGKNELLQHKPETLGFHLGCFLIKYYFEIQPKLEDHDVIHVLTNTGVSVQEEIGMQYYLFGNGKRSLYLYLVIATGTCFYPTRFQYFKNQYLKGKKAHQFHYLDFSKMLNIPVSILQTTFNIQ
jgi:hypothetical protein